MVPQAEPDELWNIRLRRALAVYYEQMSNHFYARRRRVTPPYRATFANADAVPKKSTKNEKRPDSYESGRQSWCAVQDSNL